MSGHKHCIHSLTQLLVESLFVSHSFIDNTSYHIRSQFNSIQLFYFLSFISSSHFISFHVISFHSFQSLHFIHSFFLSFFRSSLFCSFIHSFIIHSFFHSFIHSVIQSFSHSVIQSFSHSVIQSFILSFFHSFFHSFILSFFILSSFLPSFLHSFIHSFMHACMHSFHGTQSSWSPLCMSESAATAARSYLKHGINNTSLKPGHLQPKCVSEPLARPSPCISISTSRSVKEGAIVLKNINCVVCHPCCFEPCFASIQSVQFVLLQIWGPAISQLSQCPVPVQCSL